MNVSVSGAMSVAGCIGDYGAVEMDNDIFAEDNLQENIEIIVGDLEQVVSGSEDLNSCREELEALVKDLRYVLVEEA